MNELGRPRSNLHNLSVHVNTRTTNYQMTKNIIQVKELEDFNELPGLNNWSQNLAKLKFLWLGSWGIDG